MTDEDTHGAGPYTDADGTLSPEAFAALQHDEAVKFGRVPAEPVEPVEPPAEVAVVPNKAVTSPQARKAIYGVAAAIGALLLVYGLVSPEQVDAWLKVISTIITVLPLLLAFVNTPRGR